MKPKRKPNHEVGQTLDASLITPDNVNYCAARAMPERSLDHTVAPDRASLIRVNETKWANGTVLRYYFFDQSADGETVIFTDGTRKRVTWVGDDAQKEIVRRAFQLWKDVGIGLEFKEVDSRSEAEIRIGFMQDDGAWSYIGREILRLGPGDRTMNFGWDLTQDSRGIDTAIHEIGHMLGFPHEHQNPNSGIVWDDEAVYMALAKPPNRWSREVTQHNILRKIDPDQIRGSTWDPDSIMHYPFSAGLIKEPEQYRNGLKPAGGLSPWDKTWVREFYPLLNPYEYPELRPFESVRLASASGSQSNFVINPPATRYYEIQTFGAADGVMVLFEDVNGALRYRTADDNSGEATNAKLQVKLYQGGHYVLRIRLYYSADPGNIAVMMW